MTAGSVDTFEELFTYACPKFVSPAGPDYANPAANSNMEAFRAQLRSFLSVVQERKHLPALKQFLKLYTVSAVGRAAHACGGACGSCLEATCRQPGGGISQPASGQQLQCLRPSADLGFFVRLLVACLAAEHPHQQAGGPGGAGHRHPEAAAGPAAAEHAGARLGPGAINQPLLLPLSCAAVPASCCTAACCISAGRWLE